MESRSAGADPQSLLTPNRARMLDRRMIGNLAADFAAIPVVPTFVIPATTAAAVAAAAAATEAPPQQPQFGAMDVEDITEEGDTVQPPSPTPAQQQQQQQQQQAQPQQQVTQAVRRVSSSATAGKKKATRFTPEEDQRILSGHAAFGEDWERIARDWHIDRPISSIRRRFKLLAKDGAVATSAADAAGGGGGVTLSPSPAKLESMAPTTTAAASAPAPVAATTSSSAIAPPSAQQKTIDSIFQLREPPSKQRKTASTSEELRAAEEAHRQEVARLEETVKRLQEEVALRDVDIARLTGDLKHVNEARRRTDDFVRQALVARAVLERRVAREKVATNSLRIGYVVHERRGVDVTEAFREGSAFRDIYDRIEEIKKQREELDLIRRQHTKKRGGSGAAAEDDDSDMGTVVAVRRDALKREEQELTDQLQRLREHRAAHMRESKRVADEAISPLRNFPMLNKNRYQLLNLLGKGGFSEVYEAYDMQEARLVACKIHSLNPQWSEPRKRNYTKHACREYNIHVKLDHSKVVRLYDVFEVDSNTFCTVLELCTGGDLDIRLKEHGTLSEREARCIITQIFSGLVYLNSRERPIIHYDLKPANILFSRDGEVKITDFGLSKIMDQGSEMLELTSQGAGTYWYLPPECFDEPGAAGGSGSAPQQMPLPPPPPMISAKVDVWSAGVIFYQMLYGKKPFGDNMSQEKFRADRVLVNASLEFPSKPAVSAESKEIIRRCLTPSHTQRPDAVTCLQELRAIGK